MDPYNEALIANSLVRIADTLSRFEEAMIRTNKNTDRTFVSIGTITTNAR